MEVMPGFKKPERGLPMFYRQGPPTIPQATVDTAIRVSGLSKCYQIYDTPQNRLKQFILPRLQRQFRQQPQQYYREFWALKDVSFEIKKGETVGIIGRNGSGKSTLLQIICGTLSPTSGRIETNGRIAALLELGSGFNPDFSGRENIYLNAALLGLSKAEVDERFDDIAAFADIGAFIEQSVKTYSSGMVMRLAFAVQSQIEPDILIVDEALSVGDAKFQAKCFDRLRQLKESGTSILLVTHSGEQIVTHCSAAMLLNDGVQLQTGEPRQVVNRYMDLLFGKEKKELLPPGVKEKDAGLGVVANSYLLSVQEDAFSARAGYNPHEYRWGDGAAAILDYYMEADGSPYPPVIDTGQLIRLAVSIRFYANLMRPILGIVLKTKEGVTVYGVHSEDLQCESFQRVGRSSTVVIVQAEFSCQLAQGDYFISLGVATRSGDDITPHDRRYDSIHFVVRATSKFTGLVNLDLTLSAKEIAHDQ